MIMMTLRISRAYDRTLMTPARRSYGVFRTDGTRPDGRILVAKDRAY